MVICMEEVLKKQLMCVLGYSESDAIRIVSRYSCLGELEDLESELIAHESMETML